MANIKKSNKRPYTDKDLDIATVGFIEGALNVRRGDLRDGDDSVGEDIIERHLKFQCPTIVELRAAIIRNADSIAQCLLKTIKDGPKDD